jgi:hypothetical protein
MFYRLASPVALNPRQGFNVYRLASPVAANPARGSMSEMGLY